MRDFLGERIAEQEGNIVTTTGEVIGTHRGYAFYTIGQREGLGVGGRKQGNAMHTEPLYVVALRPEQNEVVVAVGKNDPALYAQELVAQEILETVDGGLFALEGKEILARIRYRQPLAVCTFIRDGENVRVHFREPQRAIAPGQFIAFYQGDELLGSGIISF